MKVAWPWTCLRAAQSRVAISRVTPALWGVKNSDQIREEPPGIRLEGKTFLRTENVFNYLFIRKTKQHENSNINKCNNSFSIPTELISTSANSENEDMLVLPVIFELGRHDPRSFHANVDFIQAISEGVCELHRRHHLFIHPTPT